MDCLGYFRHTVNRKVFKNQLSVVISFPFTMMGYLISETALMLFMWWVFQHAERERAGLCVWVAAYPWVHAHVEWRFKRTISYKKYLYCIHTLVMGFIVMAGKDCIIPQVIVSLAHLKGKSKYLRHLNLDVESEAECHVWSDAVA